MNNNNKYTYSKINLVQFTRVMNMLDKIPMDNIVDGNASFKQEVRNI